MMKLMKSMFERLIGGGKENLERIHPDFSIKQGTWSFNKIPAPVDLSYDGPETDRCDKRRVKSRFAFDDPKQLDGCGFHAKVGLNTDESLPYKYIGFAYDTTQQREKLVEWSLKFPYSEIIIGLNREWVQGKDSERIVLNGETPKK